MQKNSESHFESYHWTHLKCLEIDMYMSFRLDIDPVMTMVRPGLDLDQTRTGTQA